MGMEAHGSPGAEFLQKLVSALPSAVAEPMMTKAGVDRLTVLHQCIDAVRRGGTISVSGVYAGTADPLPMLVMFDEGVRVSMGQAHVRRWIGDLMRLSGTRRTRSGCATSRRTGCRWTRPRTATTSSSGRRMAR
ncbi:hypothetical protein AB0L88_14200 [Saccharopolyspora shandongensis]|uniref:hypothetical protein n=1 Tax=Saccharopolyspora shandongensis TaxID=418495 RepID=UPI003418AB40